MPSSGRCKAAAAHYAQGDRKSPLLGGLSFGTMFRGISLGSVLLVVALGLRHHFRPHGSHQYGSRGNDGRRRVRDLCRASASSVPGVLLAPFGFQCVDTGIRRRSGDFGDFTKAIFFSLFPLRLSAPLSWALLLERSVIQFLYRQAARVSAARLGVSRWFFSSCSASSSARPTPRSTRPVGCSAVSRWVACIMNYNRVFVIGFAVCDCRGHGSLLLAKTPTRPAHSRAVMQDRNVASVHGCADGEGEHAHLCLRLRTRGTRRCVPSRRSATSARARDKPTSWTPSWSSWSAASATWLARSFPRSASAHLDQILQTSAAQSGDRKRCFVLRSASFSSCNGNPPGSSPRRAVD